MYCAASIVSTGSMDDGGEIRNIEWAAYLMAARLGQDLRRSDRLLPRGKRLQLHGRVLDAKQLHDHTTETLPELVPEITPLRLVLSTYGGVGVSAATSANKPRRRSGLARLYGLGPPRYGDKLPHFSRCHGPPTPSFQQGARTARPAARQLQLLQCPPAVSPAPASQAPGLPQEELFNGLPDSSSEQQPHLMLLLEHQDGPAPQSLSSPGLPLQQQRVWVAAAPEANLGGNALAADAGRGVWEVVPPPDAVVDTGNAEWQVAETKHQELGSLQQAMEDADEQWEDVEAMQEEEGEVMTPLAKQGQEPAAGPMFGSLAALMEDEASPVGDHNAPQAAGGFANGSHEWI